MLSRVDEGSEPRVRASWCKLVVGTVKRRRGPIRAQLLDRLHFVRRRIRPLGITAWAPAEVLLDLDEALVDVLGRVGARELWCDNLLEAMDSALLRPIISTSLRLYGDSPASLLRMAPRIHGLVCQGCGVLELDRVGEGEVDLTLRGMPPAIRDRAGLRRAYLASCDASLARLGLHGEVVEVDAELDAGVTRIQIRW